MGGAFPRQVALGKKTEQAAESKPVSRVHGLTPVSCLEFLTCLFFLKDWKLEDQIKCFLPQLFFGNGIYHSTRMQGWTRDMVDEDS